MTSYPGRRDRLTGLYSKAAFVKALSREAERGRVDRRPCAVLLIRLEPPAGPTRSRARPSGDAALRRLGQCLRSEVRKADFLARYDDSSFALILSQTELGAAHSVAERLSLKLCSTDTNDGDSVRPNAVSIGVAHGWPNGWRAPDLLEEAEQRLELARRVDPEQSPPIVMGEGLAREDGAILMQRAGGGRKRPWIYKLACQRSPDGYQLVREWGVAGAARMRRQVVRFPTRAACLVALEAAVRRLTVHAYRPVESAR